MQKVEVKFPEILEVMEKQFNNGAINTYFSIEDLISKYLKEAQHD